MGVLWTFAAADDRGLTEVVRSRATGRVGDHRLAVQGRSASAADLAITSWLRGDPAPGVVRGAVGPCRVGFLCTGQGAIYRGAGAGLVRTVEVFRRSLRSGALKGWAGTVEEQTGLLDLGWALAQTWASWGVHPTALLGHSAGGLVAAVLAEVLEREEGHDVLAARGRAMAASGPGAMVQVAGGLDAIVAVLGARPEVEIAAVNGPAAVVLTGGVDPMLRAASELERAGMPCRRLPVAHAFHSAQMDTALPGLAAGLEAVTLSPPRVSVVSELDGQDLGDRAVDPAYWLRHAREPVRLDLALPALARKVDLTLEIGPDATLTALARDLPGVPSLRRSRDDVETLVHAAAWLWVRGVGVDLDAVVAALDPTLEPD